MFYEDFIMFADEDDPRAEYLSAELKINYYMENMIEGPDDIIITISHEWLHGLFDWATEGATRKEDMIYPEGEHFIMKLIHYNS